MVRVASSFSILFCPLQKPPDREKKNKQKQQYRMVCMTPPKFTRFLGILSKSFLFAILILSSCSNHEEKLSPQIEIAKEDRAWLEKFFHDFFLDGPNIYTLFGSKPMSGISLFTGSKKEWFENYSKLWKDLPEQTQKKNLAKLEQHVDKYDLPTNWEKWEQWRKKKPKGRFLFAKKSTECDQLFTIDILNVQEAAWSIQKHYHTFKAELGKDFDPLEAVLEFEDPNSTFWESVYSSHLLRGILHGFGERNAYFFDLQMKLNEEDSKEIPIFTSNGISRDRAGGSLKKIPLPMFRSYSPDKQEDPIYLRYKDEREKIQKELKGKNLVDAILTQLGYQEI